MGPSIYTTVHVMDLSVEADRYNRRKQ